MGPLSGYSRFNMEVCAVKKKGIKSLFSCLVDAFVNRWPTELLDVWLEVSFIQGV